MLSAKHFQGEKRKKKSPCARVLIKMYDCRVLINFKLTLELTFLHLLPPSALMHACFLKMTFLKQHTTIISSLLFAHLAYLQQPPHVCRLSQVVKLISGVQSTKATMLRAIQSHLEAKQCKRFFFVVTILYVYFLYNLHNASLHAKNPFIVTG